LVSTSKASTKVFSFTAAPDDSVGPKKDESTVQSQSDFAETLHQLLISDSVEHPCPDVRFFAAENGTELEQSRPKVLKNEAIKAFQSKREDGRPFTNPLGTFVSTPIVQGGLALGKTYEPLHHTRTSHHVITSHGLSANSPPPLQTTTRADVTVNLTLTVHTAKGDPPSDSLNVILSKYLGNSSIKTPSYQAHPSSPQRPMNLHSKLKSPDLSSIYMPFPKPPVSEYLRSNRYCRSLGASIDLENSQLLAKPSVQNTPEKTQTIDERSVGDRRGPMSSSLTVVPAALDKKSPLWLFPEQASGSPKKEKYRLRLNSSELNIEAGKVHDKTATNTAELPLKLATNIKQEQFLHQPYNLISPKDSCFGQGSAKKVPYFGHVPTQVPKGNPLKPPSIQGSSYRRLNFSENPIISEHKISYFEPKPTNVPYYSEKDGGKTVEPSQTTKFSQTLVNDPSISIAKRYELRDFSGDLNQKNPVFTPFKASVQPQGDIKPAASLEPHRETTREVGGGLASPHKEPWVASLAVPNSAKKIQDEEANHGVPIGPAKDPDQKRRVDEYLKQLELKRKAAQSMHPSPKIPEVSRENLNSNTAQTGDSSLCLRPMQPFGRKMSIVAEPFAQPKPEPKKKDHRSVTFNLESKETLSRQCVYRPKMEGIRSILKNKKPSTQSFSKYLGSEKESSNSLFQTGHHRRYSGQYQEKKYSYQDLIPSNFVAQPEIYKGAGERSRIIPTFANPMSQPHGLEPGGLRIVTQYVPLRAPPVIARTFSHAPYPVPGTPGSAFPKDLISSPLGHPQVPPQDYHLKVFPSKLCLKSRSGSSQAAK
jgi:hypothetical protein